MTVIKTIAHNNERTKDVKNDLYLKPQVIATLYDANIIKRLEAKLIVTYNVNGLAFVYHIPASIYNRPAHVGRVMCVTHDCPALVGRPVCVTHDRPATVGTPMCATHDRPATVGRPMCDTHDLPAPVGRPMCDTHGISVSIILNQ
jgi:hypothetical protein